MPYSPTGGNAARDASAVIVPQKIPPRFNLAEFQNPMKSGPGSTMMIKEKLALGYLAWSYCKTVTIGESDPESAPGHVIGLRVAECFAGEPPLRNRISHFVCGNFSCGEQEVEEKIPLLSLTFFFGRKSHLRPEVTHLYRESERFHSKSLPE
jgi:hypothetical protein